MRRSHHRPQRVADLLQQQLAELLRKESSDPRFAGVTITAVEISKDLAHAKIYITLLDETKVAETLQALNRAEGFLRHLLADQLDLRITPHLRFYYDASISSGDKLTQLINQELTKRTPKKGG